MLSFRMKLNRDTEAHSERLLVEKPDHVLHQSLLPHQGAHLSQGWIGQGRYLVCPRLAI